jgi:hypothetical protein
MNAKTWMTLCGFGPPLMIGTVAGFVFAHLWAPFIFLCVGCSLALIALSTVGAWFGILICLRRLHFGCPLCAVRSPYSGGGARSLYVDCPECGTIRITARPFRTAVASKY